LLKFELVAPEVIAETTQIVLSEGRLIEKDLILVIVNADDGSVVSEELGTDADYDITDLVIGGTLFEVKGAQLCQSLREEEVRVDKLYLRLHVFLGLLAAFFPIGQELLLQTGNAFLLDLLRIE
jgi:hypothetical protein